MRWKPVLRLDDSLHMFRIGRLLFGGANGSHHTGKLSLAVWPKLFRFSRDWDSWDLTVLGVRTHYLRAYGMV